MISCISPRLNIKSSLPLHLEALISSYVLWVASGRPSSLKYGEEVTDETGKIKLKFTEDDLAKLNTFFNSSDITDESCASNPLLTSQIEHLQVGGINLYKTCTFLFQDSEKSESTERTGGERFKKEIKYTSVIDLLDGFFSFNLEEFRRFSKPIFLVGEIEKSDKYIKKINKLLTFLVEQTKYNDSKRNTYDLVSQIIQTNSFHENGPARILKPFLKSGFHSFIMFQGHKYQPNSNDEFEDYKKRVELLNYIFSPNYCKEGDERANFSHNSESVENVEPISAPLNLLLKGVPGTGKSRAIDEIIRKHFYLEKLFYDATGAIVSRVKRVNLHAASTNSSLMQGISVSTSENNSIIYGEKTGIILDFILDSIKYPQLPFALVLEEVQENSLNTLIGDLIYLIEDSKRASGYSIDPTKDVYDEILRITNECKDIHYVNMPNLINGNTKEKRLFLPKNLHVFCTSNYRDDQKIIEDNLLRRFEVIELYPRYNVINNKEVAHFLEALNNQIVDKIYDVHNDRYLVGHANWINVDNNRDFFRALLKLVVEFKDVREVEFETLNDILNTIEIPFGIDLSGMKNYKDLTELTQRNCGYDFIDGTI